MNLHLAQPKTGILCNASSMPRSHHGCARCKSRRQKCDEEKPSCRRCREAGSTCDYAVVLKWDGRVPRRQAVKRKYTRKPAVIVDKEPSPEAIVLSSALVPRPPMALQPVSQMSPDARLLLHHFATEASKMNSHSYIREQSCGLILPMAVQSPSLMFATMALASLHRFSLLREPPRDFSLEPEVSNLISTSLQCLRLELDVQNITAKAALLETIRTLCVCEIYSGKADASWRIHVEGAKALIESSSETRQEILSDSTHWLTVTWYSSVESLTALTQRGLRKGQVELGPRPLLIMGNNGTLDTYAGYSTDLNDAFKEIGAASRERRRLDGESDGEMMVSEADLESEADWLEYSVRAMMSRDQENGLTPPPDVVLTGLETAKFSVCNEAYQNVALLHIYRRVRKLPSTESKVQGCVKAILDAVEGILPIQELSPWVLLTTPIFTAGCEAFEEDRERVRCLLQGLHEKLRIRNIRRALEILDARWALSMTNAIEAKPDMACRGELAVSAKALSRVLLQPSGFEHLRICFESYFQTLEMPARASTRVSIAWPPALPSEPTETLVLGVGGWYVDLRVTKADLSIDWAMAGERLDVEGNPALIRFTHSIDSRGFYGTDQGEFSKLPNGDDLEIGSMPAPHLGGKIVPYEEIWHEFPAPPPGSVSWILESSDGKTFMGKIGGDFIALAEKSSGVEGFAAVKEQTDSATKNWSTVYSTGPSESLQRMSKISGSLKGEREWAKDTIVDVDGVNFIVRAVEIS